MIYLLAPVQYASITGCTDCVVVVGAVTRALRVEQCERLTCIAATKRLQVRSCHEAGRSLTLALHRHRIDAASPASVYGGQGESLLPPYTRGSVCLTGARANAWCLLIHAEASLSASV